ncbi:hypothetical protein KC324_g70 [Hortaea werneckii]|nr:hypothetical protein KC324_g70 [Hortaea werneckii]
MYLEKLKVLVSNDSLLRSLRKARANTRGKTLKSGCASMRSMLPASVSRREGAEGSNRSVIDSRVSGDAKLISSKSTQSPFRTAFTMLPSTKLNAKPSLPVPTRFSMASKLAANSSHLAKSGLANTFPVALGQLLARRIRPSWAQLSFVRLKGSSFLPRCRAKCCTAVVLPTPVSPTSSKGSRLITAAATRSNIRLVCGGLRAHPDEAIDGFHENLIHIAAAERVALLQKLMHPTAPFEQVSGADGSHYSRLTLTNKNSPINFLCDLALLTDGRYIYADVLPMTRTQHMREWLCLFTTMIQMSSYSGQNAKSLGSGNFLLLTRYQELPAFNQRQERADDFVWGSIKVLDENPAAFLHCGRKYARLPDESAWLVASGAV